MNVASKGDLSRRLDAVIEEAHGRVKAFQSEAEQSRQDVRKRFESFLPIAERIVAIARVKLEQLRERLKFEVTPSLLQTERLYSRSVTLNVKSELASVIKLAFKLTHDSDVTHIFLDYDLEVVPIFFRFNPHNQLQIPTEAYDDTTVEKWLDDCLVEFASAYLELHSTKQYQERVLVSDTVAGITFPKHYAAATLDHDGSTYYFISDETRREF